MTVRVAIAISSIVVGLMPAPSRAENTPAVWVFPTVGTPDRLVVRGRAFRKEPDRGSTKLSKNLRSIVASHELPFAEVSVAVAGRKAASKADDEGWFAVEFVAADAPFDAGAHDIEVSVRSPTGSSATGRGKVFVVPAKGLSVVSDIDDTIVIADVTDKPKMFGRVLLGDEKEQPAVPGMSVFYRCLARKPGRSFHYLSGSPVGLLRRIQRFLDLHAYPPGAVLLRSFEGGPADPETYKLPRLQEIAKLVPGHQLVLVGDSGEKDPEVYAALKKALGARVSAVFIRRVTGENKDSPRFAGQLAFDRVAEAAAEAARLGLVDEACAGEVEAAEKGNRTPGPQ